MSEVPSRHYAVISQSGCQNWGCDGQLDVDDVLVGNKITIVDAYQVHSIGAWPE